MNRPSEEQLTKYFNNQLKSSEAKIVLDWLSTSEGQRYLNIRLMDDFAALDQAQKVILRPKITAEDILQHADSYQHRPVMVKKRAYSGSWKVAATVGLLAMITGVMLYYLTGKSNHEVHSTTFAESADVILPDGSTVHMSGNSRLKFEKDWDMDTDREIWFEGEGYFDIVKGEEVNRFTVHTDRDFDVQVLGTTFTITARQSASRVVLESGAIALNVENNSGKNQIMMVPGELVEIDHQNDLLIKKSVRPEIYTSRKNHVLVFESTPLKEIIRILKDDYGLTVIVNDSDILDEKFTGSVPSKDVDTLLEGLRTLLDVKIIREENIIKLIH